MGNKRSSNVIDLTQSSDAENNPLPSKKQARAGQSSRTMNAPGYHTPSPFYGHSSQLQGSQFQSQTGGSQVYGSQARGTQPHSSQSLGSRDTWSTQQDDENEIIDLSQDVDDHGWVSLGAIDGKIVGIRYVCSLFSSPRLPQWGEPYLFWICLSF